MFVAVLRHTHLGRCFYFGQSLVMPKFYSSSSSSKNPGKVSTSTYSRDNVRRQVKGYVFTRYIDYVQNYDKVLEKKFPSAMRVYRIFLIGIKDFYKDMKNFLKVSRIANGSTLGLRALTRNELELYHKMPKDMAKVAPVLLLSALPFANYVIFPLAYMFPRHLLTSHFWSIQQRSEFQEINLRHRINYNRKVLRCMQAKLYFVKKTDESNYKKWNYILGLLGSGLHPMSQEILDINDIFTKSPYDLNSLSSKHVNYLCHLHGIHRGWLKRVRLAERSYIIHHMDMAIKREGGVHNMPIDSLRNACYIRGLNPTNLSDAKMIEWLVEWVKVSLKIDGSNISLFLHLPILIAYNHPNNWKLIHN